MTGRWAIQCARASGVALLALSAACSSPSSAPPVQTPRPSPAVPTLPRYEVGEFVRVRVTAAAPVGGDARGGAAERARYKTLVAAAARADIVARGPQEARTTLRLLDATTDEDGGWSVAPFRSGDVWLPRLRDVGSYELEVRAPPGVELRVEPRQFLVVEGPGRAVAALSDATESKGVVDAVAWAGGQTVRATRTAGVVTVERAGHTASLTHDEGPLVLAGSPNAVAVALGDGQRLQLALYSLSLEPLQTVTLADLTDAGSINDAIRIAWSDVAKEWGIAWTARRPATLADRAAARRRGALQPYVVDTVRFARVGADGAVKKERIANGTLLDFTYHGADTAILFEPGVGEPGGLEEVPPDIGDTGPFRHRVNATLVLDRPAGREVKRLDYRARCSDLALGDLHVVPVAGGFSVAVRWVATGTEDRIDQLDLAAWSGPGRDMAVRTVAATAGTSIATLDSGRVGRSSWLVWAQQAQRTGRSEVVLAELGADGQIAQAYRIGDGYEEIHRVELDGAGSEGVVFTVRPASWSVGRVPDHVLHGSPAALAPSVLASASADCGRPAN